MLSSLADFCFCFGTPARLDSAIACEQCSVAAAVLCEGVGPALRAKRRALDSLSGSVGNGCRVRGVPGASGGW
jgi:hypothetical protein